MTISVSPTPKDTEAEEAGRRLAWISSWLDDSYQPVEAKSADEWRAEALLWRRTTKGAEEAGEVQGALRGLLAENPRKGQTHTADDVIGELLDTAVSALGAVEHLTGNAGRSVSLLFEKVAKIRARADSAVLAASPAVTEGERADEYGDWNGIEEAAWNLPHRALVDALPLSDEQRAAVHEALNDNYQHGHEDGIAEQNTLADIGRTLLREALGAEAAERYRDAMAAGRPLTPADQEALAELAGLPASPAVTAAEDEK